MTDPTLDDARIGPALDLSDVAIPPHLGDRLAAFYGRDERIATAREWAAAMDAAVREEVDRPVSEADMCTAPDGDHAVEFADGSQSFVCVLDPLIAVFHRNEPGTVRSRPPDGGDPVTVDIDADGAAIDPPGAVFSIGIGHGAPAGDPTLEAAYGQVCAYTHAFPSGSAYESWAEGVGAATSTLPAREGVALARELTTAILE